MRGSAPQQAQLVFCRVQVGVRRLERGLGAQEFALRDDLVLGQGLRTGEVGLRDALCRSRPLQGRLCFAKGQAVENGQHLTGFDAVSELRSHLDDAPFDARRDAGHAILVRTNRRSDGHRVCEALLSELLELDAGALRFFGRKLQAAFLLVLSPGSGSGLLSGLGLGGFLSAATGGQGACQSEGQRRQHQRRGRAVRFRVLHGWVPSCGQPAASSRAMRVLW